VSVIKARDYRGVEVDCTECLSCEAVNSGVTHVDIVTCLGVIMVLNPHLLDYETSRRHRLIVIATTSRNDAYDYATVWINVLDINDNVPQFYQDRYQSAVWENHPAHTFVLQVCSSTAAAAARLSSITCTDINTCRSAISRNGSCYMSI